MFYNTDDCMTIKIEIIKSKYVNDTLKIIKC